MVIVPLVAEPFRRGIQVDGWETRIIHMLH